MKNKSLAVGLVAYVVLVATGPVLKLTHVLHCSWWWATVLLWGPWLLAVVGVGIALWRAEPEEPLDPAAQPPFENHFGEM